MDTRKKAITGMVLGIISCSVCWFAFTGFVGVIFGVAGLVCGIISLNMVKPLKGMGLGKPDSVFVKVASICGLIGIIASAICIVFGIICGIVACTAQEAAKQLYDIGDASAAELEDALNQFANSLN